MSAEECYLRNYTSYGRIAYEEDEPKEEFDALAYGEAQWEAENGR